MTEFNVLLCVVCGEEAEAEVWVSECYSCSRSFHLNPYNNRPGKDCGDAVLGPEGAGVEMFCQDCIDSDQRAQDAAQPAGVSPAEAMMRAMYGGMLPPGFSAPEPPQVEGRRLRRVQDD